MNKRTQKAKLGECGQATLETLLLLPLAMGVLFMALAIAVLWHAQALSAHLTLEGASRDGALPGSGASFSASKQAEVAPSFAVGPSTQIISAGLEGQNQIFSMNGSASVPWAPFGLDLSMLVQASVVSPVWEFQP